MKKIFSLLFALLFMAGTTGVFTSCQEDAPEINYTISVTVNNDFTEVVNAINNGTMKQEAAIAALTAAINGMNGEQNAKMDAIVKAINDLAKTTDAKLAIIEAAMKAQTLALEAKLALLETAIKNIPDYSEKMAAIEAAIKNAPDYTTALKDIKDAIAALPNYAEQLGAIVTAIENLPDYRDKLGALETAIKALPNYTEKMGALETALETIAKNIKDQQNQYADELAALKTSIDAIKSAVEAGNKSQEKALAEIIALLESGAIAGGGSGSGSGGEGSGGEGSGGEGEGSGGEGSGDEPIGPYISFTSKKAVGSIIELAYYDSELTKLSGVVNLQRTAKWHSDVPVYQGTLSSQEVKLYGAFTKFACFEGFLTEIDTQTQGALQVIYLTDSPDLKFNFEFNTNLRDINLRDRILSFSELSDLVAKLPNTSGAEGKCVVDYDGDDFNTNAAEAKGWTLTINYQ